MKGPTAGSSLGEGDSVLGKRYKFPPIRHAEFVCRRGGLMLTSGMVSKLEVKLFLCGLLADELLELALDLLLPEDERPGHRESVE